MTRGAKATQRPTISVVVPLHHEGRIFFRTSRALNRAIRHVMDHGYGAEIILVLDRANSSTKEVVATDLFPGVKSTITNVDYGNPGMTRNRGVELAKGKYVALIDGDNLFSENWLTQGIAVLEDKPQEAVVHPQYLVAFGASQHIWEVIGSDHPEFDPYAFAESNYWDTMCITHTSLMRRIPHDPAKTSEGFGYEDWHWNGETLAAGAEHYTAPETTFFYRAKEEDSMLQQYTVQRTLMPPTNFMQPEIIDAYHHRTKQWRIKQEAATEAQEISEPAEVRKPVRASILWAARKAGKPPYALLKSTSSIHHRARDFNQGLQPLLQRLVRPPGVPPANPTQNTGQSTHSLPSWLIDEWRQMHEIEPSIFPSKRLLPYLPHYSVQAGIYTELYWKLAREIGTNADYLVVVPWLKKGGADKEVINYVRAIVELEPDAKVVVLATNNTTSPWRRFLPKSVTFLTMDKRVHGLAQEHQVHLLGTLFLQLRPKRIHVINSPLGYRVLRKYAQPISRTSDLFLLIFCLDHTDEGQKVHYVIQYLEHMFPYLTKVFADNQKVIDELVAIYNFDPQKFSTHYQPFAGSIETATRKSRSPKQFTKARPLHVLWAGRLDQQKRPDILLDIYKEVALQKLPIVFHVYGSAHLSGSKYTRAIKRQSGVMYYGPYDKGLETLPLADFDLFMLTSQWEGMPNVMLEATAGQLPILAPAVGGIAEFIIPQKTGYLVEDFDDINQYIIALKHILANYPEAVAYLGQAQELVQGRHSWESFKSQLQSEDSYIN